MPHWHFDLSIHLPAFGTRGRRSHHAASLGPQTPRNAARGPRGGRAVGRYALAASGRPRPNGARPVALRRPDRTARQTQSIFAAVPTGGFGHLRFGMNPERPSVGSVNTSEACSPENPCRRERLLSVLSATSLGTSDVRGLRGFLLAALEDARHSPHSSSVYRSRRREQTQFGFAGGVYVGVVVRK